MKTLEIPRYSKDFSDGRMLYALQTEYGRIKIGYSIDISRRIRQLENLGGSKIVKSYFSDFYLNAPQVESKVHRKLKQFNVFGEWYELPFDLAVKVIKEALVDVGVLSDLEGEQDER